MPCSIGRSVQKYRGSVVIGDGSASNLQQVTENGNTTTLSIVTDAFFIGDGGLLTNVGISNISLENVTLYGNTTSHKIQFQNTLTSWEALGNVIVYGGSYFGDGSTLSNMVKLSDFEDNVARITNIETFSLGNVQSNIINLESNVAILKNDVVRIDTDIDNLQGDVVRIDTDIDNLQGDVVRIDTDIDNLQGDIVRIDTDIDNLQGDIVRIDTDIDNLQGNVVRLENDVDLLQGNVLTIENDITILQGNIITISDDLINLEGNVLRLEANNIVTWSKITSSEQRIETIEENPIISNSYSTITSGFNQGDLIYAIGDNMLSQLNVGSVGKIIKSSGLVPYWADAQFTVNNNYTYINVILTWIQRGLDIDGTITNGRFGTSVSMSSDGSIVAAGEPGTGNVKIYSWNGTTWGTFGNIPGSQTYESGTSIDLSADGHTIVIGTPGGTGSVSVYRWSSGVTWNQLGNTLVGSSKRSGLSVSISSDGNTILVGEPGNDYDINSFSNDYGGATVYNWNGTSWNILGSTITSNAPGELNGFSVSLSNDGTVLALGEPRHDTNLFKVGRVRVFQLTTPGNIWVSKGSYLLGLESGEQFGYAVSLSGDGNTLAVGTPFSDKNGIQSGVVKVYRWNGGNWVQKGVDINGIMIGDWFGNSVAMSYDGNSVVAGSILSDENVVDAGQIRVFNWKGTVWEQVGYSINGEFTGDSSGTSVSMTDDGRMVSFGAPYHDNSKGHVKIYTSEILASDRNYDDEIIQLNSNIEELRISNLNTHVQLTVIDNRLDIFDNHISNIDTDINTLKNNEIVKYSYGITSGFNRGDLVVATGVDNLGVLPVGLSGQVLKTDGVQVFWGEDIAGTGGTGSLLGLQEVTENNNQTNITVRLLNPNTSLYASGLVDGAFFRGDGGLLSNINSSTTLDDVCTNSNITSSTIQLTNVGTSLVASGKIIASSFEGSGSQLTGVATSSQLFSNSLRITNLETSNNAIWNIPIISNSYNSITTGFVKGDLIYALDTSQLKKLAIGNNEDILTVENGVPSWKSPGSGTSIPTITVNGNYTGISNTNPENTLHVGSKLIIDENSVDTIYVRGNVFISDNLECVNSIKTNQIAINNLILRNAEVAAERPPKKVFIN